MIFSHNTCLVCFYRLIFSFYQCKSPCFPETNNSHQKTLGFEDFFEGLLVVAMLAFGRVLVFSSNHLEAS